MTNFVLYSAVDQFKKSPSDILDNLVIHLEVVVLVEIL